jgi:5-methyltetrahydropteroyltriglutamate--homocysteine methyltransferase
MKRSTERILTTHTGSLPRPNDLVTLLYAKEKGELREQATFVARIRSATAEIVQKQLECGVDIVNDGEVGKVGYSTYVKDRLTGFDGEASPLAIADLAEFPEYAQRLFQGTPIEEMQRPACTGPITYKDKEAVRKDLENFKAALQGVAPEEAFLSS